MNEISNCHRSLLMLTQKFVKQYALWFSESRRDHIWVNVACTYQIPPFCHIFSYMSTEILVGKFQRSDETLTLKKIKLTRNPIDSGKLARILRLNFEEIFKTSSLICHRQLSWSLTKILNGVTERENLVGFTDFLHFGNNNKWIYPYKCIICQRWAEEFNYRREIIYAIKR